MKRANPNREPLDRLLSEVRRQAKYIGCVKIDYERSTERIKFTYNLLGDYIECYPLNNLYLITGLRKATLNEGDINEDLGAVPLKRAALIVVRRYAAYIDSMYANSSIRVIEKRLEKLTQLIKNNA